MSWTDGGMSSIPVEPSSDVVPLDHRRAASRDASRLRQNHTCTYPPPCADCAVPRSVHVTQKSSSHSTPPPSAVHRRPRRRHGYPRLSLPDHPRYARPHNGRYHRYSRTLVGRGRWRICLHRDIRPPGYHPGLVRPCSPPTNNTNSSFARSPPHIPHSSPIDLCRPRSAHEERWRPRPVRLQTSPRP